jgi:hypothetical protein
LINYLITILPLADDRLVIISDSLILSKQYDDFTIVRTKSQIYSLWLIRKEHGMNKYRTGMNKYTTELDHNRSGKELSGNSLLQPLLIVPIISRELLRTHVLDGLLD